MEIECSRWIEQHPPEENRGEHWLDYEKEDMDTWAKINDVMAKTAGRYTFEILSSPSWENSTTVVQVTRNKYRRIKGIELKYYFLVDDKTGGLYTESDKLWIVVQS